MNTIPIPNKSWKIYEHLLIFTIHPQFSIHFSHVPLGVSRPPTGPTGGRAADRRALGGAVDARGAQGVS